MNADIRHVLMHSGPGRRHGLQPIIGGLELSVI